MSTITVGAALRVRGSVFWPCFFWPRLPALHGGLRWGPEPLEALSPGPWEDTEQSIVNGGPGRYDGTASVVSSRPNGASQREQVPMLHHVPPINPQTQHVSLNSHRHPWSISSLPGGGQTGGPPPDPKLPNMHLSRISFVQKIIPRPTRTSLLSCQIPRIAPWFSKKHPNGNSLRNGNKHFHANTYLVHFAPSSRNFCRQSVMGSWGGTGTSVKKVS